MHEHDDDALVRAAQAGDAGAFGQLYERHFGRIYGYLVKLGEPAEAEDLTAQVFLRALEALPRSRWTGGSVRAWLVRIAHNLLTDAHRRRARRRCAPLDETLPDRTPAADPADWILHQERGQEVRAAVARLPEAHRQVLALKFVAGLSNAEVAAVLGRSEGAVKAVQHAALDALRRRLARRLEFDVPAAPRRRPRRTEARPSRGMVSTGRAA
jgi:RNA polymerase sigma-70 factor, ECF subfamily